MSSRGRRGQAELTPGPGSLLLPQANLTKSQNEFKIVLKELEDSLLARLSAASGNFLGDTALVENLETTKHTASEIEEKVGAISWAATGPRWSGQEAGSWAVRSLHQRIGRSHSPAQHPAVCRRPPGSKGLQTARGHLPKACPPAVFSHAPSVF